MYDNVLIVYKCVEFIEIYVGNNNKIMRQWDINNFIIV